MPPVRLSLWANGIGAVAVQGDFATHYNNVKTGVYDGLIAFTTGVYPIKIHEVAPYMTKVDLGAMSIGAITINKKLFDSMSPRNAENLARRRRRIQSACLHHDEHSRRRV